MEFFTNYKKPGRMQETFNNKEQKVYQKEIDRKTGEVRRVVKETVNIYDKIQEYAEETKLQNILARYQVNMLSNLKNDEEKIIDLTNMPENLLETMTAIDNAKYIWERQSTEIKKQFDNDFKKFIAGSENGQLADLLNKELQTHHDKFTQIDSDTRAKMVARTAERGVVKETMPQTTQNAVQGQITTNNEDRGIVTNV